MSAVNGRGISHIQDEDVLKKMWQETEDFGKKKEIRAHMYKLREERLKDLYCSPDIKDGHLVTNKKTSFNQSMHADNLADHSFASLKRKEIRDSESPTKEVSYKIKGPNSNEGWNISKIEEHSQDGKSHRYQQSAHTSGTEYIPKGKLDFEAKNSQEQTSYHDGDDNNFVKSQGTSSNSVIRQEAVGGDENSSFRTSSTKSSTSSRTVTEMKSSNSDAIDYPRKQLEGFGTNEQNNFKTSSSSTNSSSKRVTEQKTFNDDMVDYPRQQFIIQSAGTNDQNKFRTSSNTTSSSRTVTEQKSYGDSVDYSKKHLQISDDSVIDKTTKVYTTDAPRELKSHPGYVEGRTKITRETKTLADGTVVTSTKYETSGANEATSTSSNYYTTSSNTFQDNKSNSTTSKTQDEKYSTHKIMEGRENVSSGKNQPRSRYYVEKTHTIPDSTESVYQNVDSRRESNVSEKKFDTIKNYRSHVDQKYEIKNTNDSIQNKTDTRNIENVKKETVQHIEIDDIRKNNIDIQRKDNVRIETIDQNKVNQRTVATHDVNSVPLGTPIEIEINLTRINDNQEKKFKPQSIPITLEPQTDRRGPKATPTVYDTPQRREPIKQETELKTKTKVTDGQYNTTYRTDYTNRKISVEVSPTHDAFARSLRAVSPDRLSSRTSSRNLKNSNSSLRSSSSPEKGYFDKRHPQRMSPERSTNGRCYSPTKKTPEKFSSTETITYRTSSKPTSQRISPDKNQKGRHTSEIKLTTNYSTNTLSKKANKLDDATYKTPQSIPKNVPRSSIPNGKDERTVFEITTDLDDNVSTFSHSTITKNRTDRVHSNVDMKDIKEFSTVEQKKVIQEDNSNKEPFKPDQPFDRPLKRTDTYEERCRQILGITTDTTERRRSSLEKLRKKGSTVSSLTESIPKTSERPEEVTSKKSPETIRQKSPTKQGTPIREFPSQSRKSPENYSPEKKVAREPSLSKDRKPSAERKPLQEFPSQIRKSTEKQVSPTRNSPKRIVDSRLGTKPSTEHKPIQEFPSQNRKSPKKEVSPTRSPSRETPYNNEDRKQSTDVRPIQEFPSQIRKSPEKQTSPTSNSPKGTVENRPEKKPSTDSKTIQEFPSQIRKSPEKRVGPTSSSPKTPSDNKPGRKPSTENKPIQEFSSRTRELPREKELPEKVSPTNTNTGAQDRRLSTQKLINEYPSQTPKSPEKYDKHSPEKTPSKRNTEGRDNYLMKNEITRDELVIKRYTTDEISDDEFLNEKQDICRDNKERRISTHHETKNQVHFTDHRDNVDEEILATNVKDETEEYRRSLTRRNYTSEEKSPEKNIPDSHKSPKSPGKLRPEVEEFETETIHSRKTTRDYFPTDQPNMEVRRPSSDKDAPKKKSINKKPVPASDLPKEDTSSEEDEIEIIEGHVTEGVIYDIPRNVIPTRPANTKITSTSFSNTKGENLKNSINIKTTMSDYVSEDEYKTDNYLVETTRHIETDTRKTAKEILPTCKLPTKKEPQDKKYTKSTSLPINPPSNENITPQKGLPSSKSPDQHTPQYTAEDIISKSSKQTQRKDKSQSRPKPTDSYRVDTMEQMDITEDIVSTNEQTTKTKTVEELVKNFTLKESETFNESVENTRKPLAKPTDRSPNATSPPEKYTSNQKYDKTLSQYEDVDNEDSTVVTDEITFTSGNNKKTPFDEEPQKPSIKSTQKSPNKMSPSGKSTTPQNSYECEELYNKDIEVKRKESTTKDTVYTESQSIALKRTPTDKELLKPDQQIPYPTTSPKKPLSSQNADKDVRPRENTDTEKSFTAKDNPKSSNQPTQKGPNDFFPSKKLDHETNKIIKSVDYIDIEQYDTKKIESTAHVPEYKNSPESLTINKTINDNFICKPSQHQEKSIIQPSKKPSVDDARRKYDESDIEVEEIVKVVNEKDINVSKQTKPSHKIIKNVISQDVEITEIHENNYLPIDEDSRRPTKKPTKNTSNKSPPQKPTTTQKYQNVKDIQKPSQRTPSGSPSKKPTTLQKIDKNENLKVRKNEVTTMKKTTDQKRTEIDFVKTKGVPISKTNKIPSKSYPSEKSISRKPAENVDRGRKPTKKQPDSDDSSEVEEEIHTKKHLMETYEGRTPVEEPLVMKKAVRLLGSDDEDDKKTTQLLIESEIIERQPFTEQKKLKPVKSPKTTTAKLIDNEKEDFVSQKSISTSKTSPPTNRSPKKPITEKKTEIPKQTHPNEYRNNRRQVTTKVNKQNTIKDIENFEDLKEDRTTHLRTNRVDETVNKKKTTILRSNDDKPANKVPKVSTSTTPNGTVPKKSLFRNTVEKTIGKTTTKTKEPIKPSQKATKSTQQKSTVSSTISSKTKTESKTLKSSTLKAKTEPIKSKPVSKRITEPEDSDEESLPDSLNGSVYSSLNDVVIQEKEVQMLDVQNVEDFEIVHQTTSCKTQPELFDEKPKVSKPKSSRSTKSIIINTNDRGTVDLQRSISSREPTPDRVCPLPVTSDDDGYAPRYPDKVVEPDEGSTKRRRERLFETSIHEDSEYSQSKKIMEINDDMHQSVTGIDRVDNDDDSLMTVDRKINKFLSTAGKLTEKSIVDISQPAPKVERPKFEVNDDLKEDDCLLSVSDKVQKFITEAEHLTTQKDTQHRKSINIEVKSDVSNKINQFTIPQQSKPHLDSPRKSSVPKNNFPSDKGSKPSENEPTHPESQKPINLTTLNKTKLDQDVFITTECAEIEKEEDFFRTSKLPSQHSVRRESQPDYKYPKATNDFKSKTNEKTSTVKKISIDNIDRSDEDSDRVDDSLDENPNDTPSKPRKNSLKEFTPKNRRSSQEDKVILSSVGRLRSNESIKKAKALFENTESIDREEKRQKDILSRPSVFEGKSKTIKETSLKKNIDRNSVTPKRLDFTSEREIEDTQQTKIRTGHEHYVEPQSPNKLNGRPSTERDLPGYMKPLERNSKPREQTPEPRENLRDFSEQDDSRRKYPDVVGPTREGKPKSYQESPESQVPGYMKPLEYREPNHRHREKAQTPEPEDVIRHREHRPKNSYDSPDSEVPGYMQPLEYTRPEHSHKVHTLETREHEHISRDSHVDDDHQRNYKSTEYTSQPRAQNEDDTPGYMKPLDRSSKPQHSQRERSKTPENQRTSGRYPKPSGPEDDLVHRNTPETFEDSSEGDLPGYMKPLDRSDRTHRPHSPKRVIPADNKPKEPVGTPTKFGVTLKRTDSSKGVITSQTTSTMKKHPLLTKKNVTEEDIEDVYDLEVLEELLLKFTIYELRRKIRTQIRIVKKLISENKLEITIRNLKNRPKEVNQTTETTETAKVTKDYDDRNVRRTTPTRKIQENRHIEHTNVVEKREHEISEYRRESLRKESVSSSTLSRSIETRKSKSPEKVSPQRKYSDREQSTRKTPERTTPDRMYPERRTSSNPTTERASPERRSSSKPVPERSSPERRYSSKPTTERSSPERRSSSKPVPERSSPERRYSSKPITEKSSPERRYSSKPTPERNIVSEEITTSYESTQRITGKIRPEEPVKSNKNTTTNVFKSSLKKTEPKSKAPASTTQPEWITQRNLRKTGSNEVVKKSSVSSSSTTVKKQSTRSSSTQESESTDLIASSYGIGPTDENGAPLFGLKALRAQNTNGTTKVQGTVISSQYYSETGKEPIGQISFTKYSSDPRDLGSNEDLTQNGDILSVTTTQKYGYDDAPSLKQLTSTKKEICDSQTNRRKSSSSKSSTITRRNSVKALTQKFVENAVEVSKSERQSSYPKAGLILRSSSFKNESANDDDDYNELSGEERREESVSVNSSHSKVVSGGTFLRNKSKVTGVEDAITRMKTEDVEYGDTEDDIEAKGLLNKYLGTQVILSGIEGQVSRTGTSSTRDASFTTSSKSTSKVTTVTMENGKEVTRTRTFEHPISDDVLETVWDEQTLRYLLDQSTNYDERKKLRARLRVIMAEQEACTELVKQASQDQSSQSIDETIETSKEVVSEGPVTTTKVTRVSTQQHISKKPMSPFAKFRQLDKQNSLNTPPSTPRTPGGSPLFKFTDAALSQSASTIKDRLLHWCRMKTKEYENIQLDNFSSSWADGLAFCALIHHFQPDAFDYHALTPKERRHNFTLAFKVADEKADIAPLLDVDDMVATMRPDWKCVFTYVQSIYRRFKDED